MFATREHDIIDSCLFIKHFHSNRQYVNFPFSLFTSRIAMILVALLSRTTCGGTTSTVELIKNIDLQ